MSETAEKLKTQLAVLSLDDRVELLEFLEGSLSNGNLQEIDAAWEAEINRRIAMIESGRTVGIPWEQVNERLRKKYG